MARKNEPIESVEAKSVNFDLSIFDSPSFAGESASFPSAVILNKEKPLHGLFVKASVMKQVGWKGPEPNHVNSFSDGTEQEGCLFQQPRMHVIDVSGRFIEARKEGSHPMFGSFERGAILGSYETPEGKLLREELGELATLRTLYLIFLLDEKNRKMHDIPLCLPIHGTGAAELGRQYKAFTQQLEIAYAKYRGLPYQPKNQNFYALGVFAPTFASIRQGKNQTSPVCTCTGFEEVNENNFLSYFVPERLQEFQGLVASPGAFASRYFNSIPQHHAQHHVVHNAIAPGANTYSLPQANSSAISSESGRGDEEFTGTTVSASVVKEEDEIPW